MKASASVSTLRYHSGASWAVIAIRIIESLRMTTSGQRVLVEKFVFRTDTCTYNRRALNYDVILYFGCYTGTCLLMTNQVLRTTVLISGVVR